MKVAFDVDGTLIYQVGEKEDTPRHSILLIFKILKWLKFEMFVWSDGDEDYAEFWRNKLGLDAKVVEKGSFVPFVAFDNEKVKLGRINIRV